MSELTLVIGNKNYSSWSLRPWFLLRALDIPFREVMIKLYIPGAAEEIRRWSVAGRVPILRHGDLTVWDSLAIAEYVGEAIAPGRVWPASVPARAEARSIAAEMHSGFSALRHEMPMNIRGRRRISPSANCSAEVERVRQIWNTCRTRHAADGPWLFGRFSAADAMFAPVVWRFHTYAVTLDEPAASWDRAIREHPAMREWAAASTAEREIIAEDEVGEPVD